MVSPFLLDKDWLHSIVGISSKAKSHRCNAILRSLRHPLPALFMTERALILSMLPFPEINITDSRAAQEFLAVYHGRDNAVKTNTG
jgi:hypothetical protein